VKNLVIYRTLPSKAIVESPKPVAYAIDGEVFRKERIEVQILPSALSFVVPAK
jgi:diacylglycerol kinase family enzyme